MRFLSQCFGYSVPSSVVFAINCFFFPSAAFVAVYLAIAVFSLDAFIDSPID